MFQLLVKNHQTEVTKAYRQLLFMQAILIWIAALALVLGRNIAF